MRAAVCHGRWLEYLVIQSCYSNIGITNGFKLGIPNDVNHFTNLVGMKIRLTETWLLWNVKSWSWDYFWFCEVVIQVHCHKAG